MYVLTVPTPDSVVMFVLGDPATLATLSYSTLGISRPLKLLHIIWRASTVCDPIRVYTHRYATIKLQFGLHAIYLATGCTTL
jgi:hypothetical protein